MNRRRQAKKELLTPTLIPALLKLIPVQTHIQTHIKTQTQTHTCTTTSITTMTAQISMTNDFNDWVWCTYTTYNDNGTDVLHDFQNLVSKYHTTDISAPPVSTATDTYQGHAVTVKYLKLDHIVVFLSLGGFKDWQSAFDFFNANMRSSLTADGNPMTCVTPGNTIKTTAALSWTEFWSGVRVTIDEPQPAISGTAVRWDRPAPHSEGTGWVITLQIGEKVVMAGATDGSTNNHHMSDAHWGTSWWEDGDTQ